MPWSRSRPPAGTPFGAGPAEAVAYRILHHPPDLAGVPGSLVHLVRAALAGDPAARPGAARLAAALAAASPPTLPLPATGPTRLLPAAGGGPGAPHAAQGVAVGPTRRRRGHRVGRLLVAVALLAGLVAAPQVVLAAVAGPDLPAAGPERAKRCPDDPEDAAGVEARREREPEGEDGDRDEQGDERRPDPADGDGRATRPGGIHDGHDGEEPQAGDPREAARQAPPPSGRGSSGSDGEVLGS